MAETTNQKRYKLGLALSGGGAKGFAHIGVFRMCLESGHNLPRALFSLNFLTGLPEEYGDIDDAYGEGVDYSALLAEYLDREKRRK